MKEFIVKYWLQVLLGLVVSVLSYICKKLQSDIKQKYAEQIAIKEALKAILHDRLFESCNYYIKQGYIPLDDADKIMDNISMMYNSYHALGGNGTGTEIYNRFMKLQLK